MPCRCNTFRQKKSPTLNERKSAHSCKPRDAFSANVLVGLPGLSTEDSEGITAYTLNVTVCESVELDSVVAGR